ncbi:glycosyltransferase family 2 protein [Dyadobacter sediminis]|nr:glycosyltransferase family 2 protein [Dyadobacter sediminis]GGB96947.1 hypothetical protein GCM10011325_25340 [Dyadobacter sediminis]
MSEHSIAAHPSLAGTSAEKKYSIIIPHKNSFELLTRLLASIPVSDDIQIIIVDDSSRDEQQQKLRDHDFGREVNVLFETAAKGAGSARNKALRHASGKWLLFADADDFFSDGLLDLISPFYNAEEDVVFFGTTSVFNNDMHRTAYRHHRYHKLVTDYAGNPTADHEDALKYYFNPPWAKLIRREMVEKHKIRFQEILASNDIFFSMNCGFRARKIAATTKVLYTITVTPNSISNSFSREHFDARFQAVLTANDFLRSIGKGKYQQSVLYYLGRSHAFGWKYTLYVLKKLVRHRSNLLIGIEKVFGYKQMLSQRENPSLVPVSKE